MRSDPDYVCQLRATVVAASDRLARVPDDRAGRRPAPDKWSVKEIVGHLLDSAANNHARFVRAQLQDDLLFPGYAQDQWVAVQAYQRAPWPALALLWRDYNLQIAHVMSAMTDEVRLRTRVRHNLHEIAWQAVPSDRAVTLDYFMRDYVAHLHHHLRQIDALLT